MLPEPQVIPPRPYRADSPIPSTPEASSSLHHPRPPSLEPSTPGTFSDSSRPLTILNYGEPHAYRPHTLPNEAVQAKRVPFLVTPTSKTFVRFESIDGHRFWPFDDVCRDETSSLRSTRSGETVLDRDFTSSPAYEEQAVSPRLRDSRWVPEVVDPWGKEDGDVSEGKSEEDLYTSMLKRRGDLTVRNSSERRDSASERAAFFAGAPIAQFRPPKRTDSEDSGSSRLSQETVDAIRCDRLATVRKRPVSRQTEFFFLPNENLNGTSWSISAVPPSELSSGSSASADTIDVRHLQIVAAHEQPDGLIETVSRTMVDGAEFTITSTSRKPDPPEREARVVSHRKWLDGWEVNGLWMAQQEREKGTKPTFLQRFRGKLDSKRERKDKWWHSHPLNKLGFETAILPESVAKDPGKSKFIAPDMDTFGRSRVPANGLKSPVPPKDGRQAPLQRAKTEAPRRRPEVYHGQRSRPSVRWKAPHERGSIDAQSDESNCDWKDAHCDVFRSNAFKGKSLDLSRGNTQLPLPGDRTWREKIREARIRGFLKRWISRKR